MPVYLPPHKPPPADDPGRPIALAMCRALVEREERLEVSTLEIDRGGRSYTVDTLEAVHASHPDAQLTLILGADMACTLPIVAQAARDPAACERRGRRARPRVGRR